MSQSIDPHGILIVDKPAGPTSHDVVDVVRKLLRTRKVGHTGTLDPAATGVLPIVVGKGTKLAQYLTGAGKSYDAEIALGTTTDTLDAQGEVVAQAPVHVTREQLEETLDKFRGDIKQLPPMYSAKKHKGKKLYELARKGVDVEREPKDVTISRLDLLDFSGTTVTISMACSAGTYVRVLAADLGQALGCGGHLKSLRRTASGPFGIQEATPLAELEDNSDLALEKLRPLEDGVHHLPWIEVPSDLGRRMGHGYQLTVNDLRTVDLPDFTAGSLVAVGVPTGQVIAVTRALIPSDGLGRFRRDEQGLKTERMFVAN